MVAHVRSALVPPLTSPQNAMKDRTLRVDFAASHLFPFSRDLILVALLCICCSATKWERNKP